MPQQTLRRMVGELKQMTEAAGRNFSELQIAPQYIVHVGRDQEKTVARFRQSQMFKHPIRLKNRRSRAGFLQLGGCQPGREHRDRDCARHGFREAGVTHFLGLFFAANSVPELLDQMQIFAEEVRPKIRA